MKYHINSKGQVALCYADKRSCPLGNQDVHFEDKVEAQAYRDTIYANEHGVLKNTEYVITNEKELQEYAEDWFVDTFGYSVDIPIKINKRMKYPGRFNYRMGNNGVPNVKIEIAEYELAEETFADTLKHELIHYYMFSQGKEWYDGSEEFEAMLKKHNLPSNEDD